MSHTQCSALIANLFVSSILFAGALTPSLLPVKPPEGTGSEGVASLASPIATPPALEVQEFPPLEIYHPHTHYHPRLTFTHHLYVYPNHLKYDGQKSFAKASERVS